MILNENKQQVTTLFQVLNDSGYPAGDEYNKLAIFESLKDAEQWIEYLESLGPDDNLNPLIKEHKL